MRLGIREDIWEEMKKLNTNILALQETKIKGTGIQKMRRYTLFHSGEQNKASVGGVAFMISNKIEDIILDFKGYNERLCILRIKTKHFNITFVNCYAPTEDKSLDIKEKFYEELSRIFRKIPKHDIVILLGDMNAKVGREECNFPTVGKCSLHSESNENGNLFINFCTENNLIIASTKFHHKDIHKGTWLAPDGSYVNQIDHVAIGSKHMSYMMDVKSYRGPDCSTDHFLVLAKLRVKLSSTYKRPDKTENIQKYNLQALIQPNIKSKYIETVNKLLEKDPEEDLNINKAEKENIQERINTRWTKISTAIKKSAKECLGMAEKKIPYPRDEEIIEWNLKKKKAREKALSIPTRSNWKTFREIRNKASKARRQKKREILRNLMKETEDLRSNLQIRQYYQRITNCKKGFQTRTSQCKDQKGNLVSGTVNILKRWREHFSNLLASDETQNGQPIQFQKTVLSAEMDIQPPTIEETEKAVAKLKNNKACGDDGIPAELLKHGGDKLITELHELIQLIWKEESMPSQWNTSVIIPIYKKGDKLLCQNYRGISLLNMGYKVLSNIIYDRLKDYTPHIIGKYQTGFIENKSTIDQIFSLRMLSEKLLEFGRDLHVLYIDFKQAFDSINRNELLKALEELGIPLKYINLIKMTLDNTLTSIKIDNQISDYFEINQGVKQGDSISPVLFNLILEKAIRDRKSTNFGARLNGTHQLFAFADDIAIVAENQEGIENILEEVEKCTKRVGLQINVEKTKYSLISRRSQTTETHIDLLNYKFEIVEEFGYLGSIIHSKGGLEQEIKYRIANGVKCFYSVKQLLRSKELSRRTKLEIYKTIIKPVVTYGSETWTLNKKLEMNLNCFERKILRAIFGPIQINENLWRIRTNTELSELYQEPDLVATIKKNRLRWLGHLERMKDDEPVKKLYKATPPGTRPRGRPRNKWIDGVLDDLKKLGEQKNWREKTKNRNVWRKVVEAAGALNGP